MKRRIADIRRRLADAVESLTDLAKSGDAADAGADLPRYRLTLAFYPLDETRPNASRRATGRRAARRP